MNEELDSQGYVTMPGRIPRAFWATKMFGYGRDYRRVKKYRSNEAGRDDE